ncbi:MAG: hypothetical protein AKCLJLPJ_02012 [Fimbriimonadales bacterium]|nr:hypothetical protein [Fimbriimonadales bacterium]
MSAIMRFLYTLGSLAPIFIALAIQGEPIVNNRPLFTGWAYLVTLGVLAILPTALLALRWRYATNHADHRMVSIGKATSSKDYLLVYLLAVLTPTYSSSFTSLRDWMASAFILVVIIILFWHFDLYHMNILFAMCGYRTFVVQAHGDNPLTCRRPIIVLSKRTYLVESQLPCIRLSDSVYIERQEER